MMAVQSVDAASGARSCSSAMAAWSWYGPAGPSRMARARTAWPSAMADRSQRVRSWSSSSTSSPCCVESGGSSRFLEQHQCQEAMDLRLVAAGAG